jgi:hypothetical protein
MNRRRSFWIWSTKESGGLFYAKEGVKKPNVRWALEELEVIEIDAYNEVYQCLIDAVEELEKIHNSTEFKLKTIDKSK